MLDFIQSWFPSLASPPNVPIVAQPVPQADPPPPPVSTRNKADLDYADLLRVFDSLYETSISHIDIIIGRVNNRIGHNTYESLHYEVGSNIYYTGSISHRSYGWLSEYDFIAPKRTHRNPHLDTKSAKAVAPALMAINREWAKHTECGFYARPLLQISPSGMKVSTFSWLANKLREHLYPVANWESQIIASCLGAYMIPRSKSMLDNGYIPGLGCTARSRDISPL